MRIQEAMPNRILANRWSEINWEDYETTLRSYQRDIALAAKKKNFAGVSIAQKNLVESIEAKALAVRQVCSSNAQPGPDRVKWTTDVEKMKAANMLNPPNYTAKPTRLFKIFQEGSGKERHIQVPCYFDRTMHILYAYALDPVCESTSDRKSFYSRKGRSPIDVHAFIMRMFSTRNPPRYVIKTDVMACYGSISHSWLLRNIPMDKAVLYQFLKVSHVLNGKLFPNRDRGIALGLNISHILCNMTLNGMQAAIFRGLHDHYNPSIDYTDGDLIRYADDMLITARTRETAEKILEILTPFLAVRGLRLSEPKTKIINAVNGFDFIGRHYRYVGDVFIGKPSENAISEKKQKMRELIIPYRGGQKALIELINKKLIGWATYHRCSDAEAAFREMDVAVKALLLELCNKLHPGISQQKIIERYFYYIEPDGTKTYALEDKPDVRVHRLADTLLVQHHPVKVTMNPYIDTEYYEKRTGAQAIRSVTGKYRTIWERQNGCCYYCGEVILADHEKRIALINPAYPEVPSNMAYVHEYCETEQIEIYMSEKHVDSNFDVHQLLTEMTDKADRRSLRCKLWRLTDYFHRCNESHIKLTFAEIEKILGCRLCKGAYTHQRYWYNRSPTNISKCWIANDYTLQSTDMKKQTITLERSDATKGLMSITIPPVFLHGRVPANAKIEVETFFEYLMKKYGLHKDPNKGQPQFKNRPPA